MRDNSYLSKIEAKIRENEKLFSACKIHAVFTASKEFGLKSVHRLALLGNATALFLFTTLI